MIKYQFQSTGIFLLLNIPKAFLPFCHSNLIHWSISSSISPLSSMIEPKYLNFSALCIATSPMVTYSPPAFLPLNPHFKYSVFDLLNLNPIDSNVCFHCSNLLLRPFLVPSIKIMSSINSIHHGTSS